MYSPPKEVIKKLRIGSNTELHTYVNICAGIMKWALNDKHVQAKGAEWVYSCFHIRETRAHGFFYYQIDGDAIPSRFTILEFDSHRFKHIVGSFDGIRAEMIWLKENGYISDLNMQFTTNDRISAALEAFREYIFDEDGIVYENKKVTGIYRGITVAENARFCTALRMPGPGKAEYTDAKDLIVYPFVSIECQECGKDMPCCTSTTVPYCKACTSAAMGDGPPIDCEHYECFCYNCAHYAGGAEYDDDDYGEPWATLPP